MRLIYPIKLRRVRKGPPSERGIVVSFPDLPEALTWGDDEEEAFANAADCLEEALAARITERDPIPRPSPRRGAAAVAPGSLIAAKTALYLALREAGIKPADLARRLGVAPQMVTRLLDPAHASKPDQIDNAIAALGHRTILSLETV